MAADRDGIAAQYTSDFSTVFEGAEATRSVRAVCRAMGRGDRRFARLVDAAVSRHADRPQVRSGSRRRSRPLREPGPLRRWAAKRDRPKPHALPRYLAAGERQPAKPGNHGRSGRRLFVRSPPRRSRADAADSRLALPYLESGATTSARRPLTHQAARPGMLNFACASRKTTSSLARAHFITFAGGICERLHGHNWRTAVELTGPLDENHYVFDFIALRDALQKIVDGLDHRVLLPTRHPKIRVEERPTEVERRSRTAAGSSRAKTARSCRSKTRRRN